MQQNYSSKLCNKIMQQNCNGVNIIAKLLTVTKNSVES